MVTSNKSKTHANNKGGGIRRTKGTVHVTNTAIPGNFKINDNEGPLPQDRLFWPYNTYGSARLPQYFLGVDVSGDFQQTNFAVAPPFTVNSSGAMGGLFGGVLIPVPNTNIFMGPRLGWQGGNISGSIVAPPASPFTYRATTNSIFYQEAMVEIPFFQDLYHRLYDEPPAQKLAYPPNLFLPFVTASAGIAEVHTDVKGTLGGFSVTDGGYRPGITLTTGLGVPVGVVMNGATVDVFVQWRGTMTTATVNIPGSVPQVYWVNGIDFGVQFRY